MRLSEVDNSPEQEVRAAFQRLTPELMRIYADAELARDLAVLGAYTGMLFKRHRFSAANSERVSVLNLACGEFREAELLAELVLPDASRAAAEAVELVGVDARLKCIRRAEQRIAHGQKVGKLSPWRQRLLHGDALSPRCGLAVDGDFDLVVLRHQNYWHDPRVWTAIFAQALASVTGGGLILLTSYFDREHELALETMRRLGAVVEENVANRYSRPLPEAGKSVDRHFALLRVG